MKLDVVFQEQEQTFSPVFGEVHNISDGGYERGYAAGVQSAQAEIVGLVSKANIKFRNDKVISVGTYVFSEATSLEEVDLPMCEIVGNYAFQSSTNLHTVKLPKVKTIGTRAFVNTSHVQRLDLPVCERIGDYCFHGLAKINTLILRRSAVCALGTDAFGTGPIKSGSGFVYVPAALVEQYKTAANWSTYASQIRAIEDYPEITGETT